MEEEVSYCKGHRLRPKTISKGKCLVQLPLVILSQDLFTFEKNTSFGKETMEKIAFETFFWHS